jgi:hypothetical protein
MIKYALACHKGHSFESWFADSAAYDKQAKRGLVTCPQCGSVKVEKAIMAPRVAGARKRGTAQEITIAPEKALNTTQGAAQDTTQDTTNVAVMSPVEQELRAKLKELREHIVKNADNVGEKFPEEARKIHYGETEHRSIYGVASLEDAKELAEEGIDVHPIPLLPDERN